MDAITTWSALLPFSSLWLLPLAILLLSSSYYYKVKAVARRSYGGRRLPPGSLGLPLLGENLQFLIGNTGPLGTPRPFLSSRLRKYGTIFKTHLLGHPTVISMDANFNKLLLANEEKLVHASFPSFMRAIIGQILEFHGEEHLQLRDLIKSVLSPSAIQALHFFRVQEYARNLIHSWSNMHILDIQYESRKFVLFYILKFLLNLEPEDPTTHLLMKDFRILLKFQTSMPVDLPGTTFNKAKKACERIYTIIGDVIKARRKVMGTESKDFLDMVLQENQKYDRPFTDQNIVEIIVAIVIASHDTTNNLLTNVIKFLLQNPEAVDELKKEHMSIRKSKNENEFLDWDDFKQMRFTKLVIKETLRLTSIAQYVPREALQDIVYRDMVIPKGWKILINFSMLHLDPTDYENPLKFNPWRWQNTKTSDQAFYMPFGGGLRLCLGILFAEVEVALFIHYLITKYKLEAVMDKSGQRDVVCGPLISEMENGLMIKIAPL